MNSRNEYLVKYSVAPPPSRDYYGLRIVQDEVILYLWKISHGPHKAPIVHRAKFTKFGQQKLLQDEIRHGFGEHVLNHVKNIVEGNRNTLLTLPGYLIGKISRYLEYRDIVKLSSLSRIAYEVKETIVSLYSLMRQTKKNLIKTRDKSILQNLRTQSLIKHVNDAKTKKPLLRTTNASKPISNTVSTVNIATKLRSEFSNANLTTTSFSKTSPDTRFRGLNTKTEKEKSLLLKKNLRSFNSESSLSEKSVKNEKLIASRITTKGNTRSVSKHGEGFTRKSEKPEKYIDKNNKIKITSQEDATQYIASRTSLVPKSTVGNIKSSSGLARGLHGKPRSKMKVKPKKAAVTSSEIFNNDKVLSDNPFVVRDNNFDLADLIEASLKNIRSPRSIFDYDFSYMQRTGDSSRGRHELLDVDNSKQSKFVRSNVVPNYFPGRMVRGSEFLEKLSEKSESYSETSTESIVKDVKVSEKNHKFLSKKCTKIPMELRKFLNVGGSEEIFSKDRQQASFQTKCFSPRKICNIDEKLSITRGPLRTSSLLKSHASNSLESKKGLPVKSIEIE
ncbi:uncharacterized protein LOC116853808 [Odontomachus brunneus]|uniref:uncharacterized protein LOC116853808 n=1 Tax=Odontomachus brunneus TaxID=486640 RepID=UPI0013F1B5F8|nr:uncharacterized protein LOC116853808 [Odontomachus brunneus]